MKLLVISAAYPPHRSGEATNAYHLCHNLAETGVDVHVLTSQGCTDHPHPRITLHPVMKHWSWGEMGRMRRVFKRCAPDAVLLIYIGWVYHHQFMITYAPTLCKKVLPGVPFVTRFENTMGADHRFTSFGSRLFRKWMAVRYGKTGTDYCYGTLLRDSDRIIALSTHHRRLLSEIHPSAEQKTVLIPPPSNMCMSPESSTSCQAELRRKYDLPPDTFIITYLGYIHAGKGLDSLLHAFQEVAKEWSNLRLMLMGGTIDPESGNPTAYVQELQALSRELGLGDKVLWTGAYSGTDDSASRLLRASDLCVLPFARGVHLNNSSFASAAAHGLPVITTRGTDLEEQFVHGENVYLCPPQSPPALAAAIRTVVDDAPLRMRLRAGIGRLTEDWFSWDRAVEQTLAACSPGPRTGSRDSLVSPGKVPCAGR
ncbi:MAG: glycosyltransferase family 4 protein [Gemmataceae bacterium]|nr:glycosyltransferase family 4 protein [Gemmataceae bacterium]